ncbi:uncharacterized protein DFL_006589 [Arthrobotrys flagrans]|uniref:F-box domain-containing protein n=1 Tax=Arthrobotrys flagrans TaxID=97331 RepID=A0A436ZTN0_ARTFL|nr:hypothetical protein DFL_006589 [Arthrobotrys flagrans]
MGYENLPLEIEFKVLDEVDWTETLACSQVCHRWKEYLAKSNAHSRRYIPNQQLPEPTNMKKFKSRHDTRLLRDFSIASAEITVSISTNEGETDENVGIISQDIVLNRTPMVLLHRFMHEAEHSIGFFINVGPRPQYTSWRRNLMPQGFFLIGNRDLYLRPNSLGGSKGSLLLPEPSIDHESSSEDSIDSDDEKEENFFTEKGRFAIQLNSAWHWDERIFNTPMCDTEIIYGRGFESFKSAKRASPYNPRMRTEKYLRRLSELDFEPDKPITVRQLVGAITQSVTTIKRLEPDLKKSGDVFYVKFDGIRIQEYMKYIPHGFFDFQTGGRIELEIYQGVNWVEEVSCSFCEGR